jgi:ubiquinone/menaquinone biosynthesis C-methylase UbiE
MLGQLRQRYPLLSTSLGRAEDLRLPDEAFDLVYTVDVIHHVRERARSFLEAFRVLRPAGLVCTVTDSEEVIRSREPLAKYFPEIVDIELGRYPSILDVRRFMQAAGFNSIREDTVERTFFFSDASPIRERVFSCLRLLDDDAFNRGISRLDEDLARGPVRCVWRYVLLWGSKS